MINENSARTAGGFFHGTLYRFGSLLPGGVRTGHVSWEMVNTGCVPKVYFQGIEDVVLIVELTHANFAERQQIMGNETPDKHCKSAENTCQKNARTHNEVSDCQLQEGIASLTCRTARFEDVVKHLDVLNGGRGDSSTRSYGVVNGQMASQHTHGEMVLKVAAAPK